MPPPVGLGTAGMPNTSGLVSRRSVIAASDAAVVSRLKQAGAIPLGVTNCSELCMWYESSNRVYGRTNNPYDLQRIVGGSSGGEGCALAAACSVVGVGSDIGGSIRMPAFFNGVFGHKPTTGRLAARVTSSSPRGGMGSVGRTPSGRPSAGIAVRNWVTPCGTGLLREHSWGWQLGSFWWQNTGHMGGRCLTQVLHPHHGMFSQGRDLLGCFSAVQCPDWVLFLPSPPRAPCCQHLWGSLIPGEPQPCAPSPPAGLCPAGGGAEGAAWLCARRGGAQRRPVPQRRGGAEQLPVHGAHVPLRRGPGARAEGHGRAWRQQVSPSRRSQLLSWSQQLAAPHSVLALCTRQLCSPPTFPVTGFLPLLLASAGPWLLGLPFPPPRCSWEQQPWADG
uniref:Amidase domain-containing protein n=1 Tax=Ficedula albicollis TaxID=59894 RepID=A0A803V9W8_FICAL